MRLVCTAKAYVNKHQALVGADSIEAMVLVARKGQVIDSKRVAHFDNVEDFFRADGMAAGQPIRSAARRIPAEAMREESRRGPGRPPKALATAILLLFLALVPRGTKANDAYGLQAIVTSTNALVTGSAGLVASIPGNYRVTYTSIMNTGTAPLYIALSGTIASASVYDAIAWPVESGTVPSLVLLTATGGAIVYESGSSNFHWSEFYGP